MRGFLVTLLWTCATGIAVGQQTSHVIVVVIDGARYSETFGDPSHQWIPRIWGNLTPQSAIFFSCFNDGRTQTTPGHGCIMTGTRQDIMNDGTERPHQPTVFEYCRKALGTSAEDNHVVLGKTKLDILAYSDHGEYGVTYGATVTNSASQSNDQMAADQAIGILQAYHPRLLVLNLPATDYAGHSGVWTDYVTALRRADSLVYEIWSFVQTDPTLSETTTMFVTNDHGRHLDGVEGGFSGHGDDCEGCRHILLLAIGPDTPAGIGDASPRKQEDIAPTIGQLLGFPTPYATGTAIDMTALPVQLQQFTGRFSSGRGVELQWRTLTETNNFGFYVQRRASSAVLFQEVPSSFRPGHGTSLVPHWYTFEDTTVGPGLWLYRLKQVDLDGTVSLSESLAVGPVPSRLTSGSFQLGLLQNYPNPFNPSTTIKFELPKASDVRLSVFDMLGRDVSVLVNERRDAGVYEVKFDASALSSGVYFYRLLAGEFVQSKKLLLSK